MKTICAGCGATLTNEAGERLQSGNFTGELPRPTRDTNYAWCDECVKKFPTKYTFADIVEARVARLGTEMLKRTPEFFNKDRLTRFLHAFSHLEGVFPEVDWNEVSVRQLTRAAERVLQMLSKDG